MEEDLNCATSAQSVTGLAFNRRAYVGVVKATYGSLTTGLQYASYMFLSPYSQTTWLTGAYGARAGDIDSLNTLCRANNSLVYTSLSMHGLAASGSHSLGGLAGSTNVDSTYSLAVQYLNGLFWIATGYPRINNSTLRGGAWGADSTTSNVRVQAGVSDI